MLVVVPIFLGPEDTGWETPQGRNVLQEFFSAMNQWTFDIQIFSDRKDILLTATEAGLSAMFSTPDFNRDGVLPKGGFHALEQGRNLSVENPIAVLDFRNPLIGEVTVCAGLEAAFKDRLAASVAVIREHPCRRLSCRSFAEVNFIHCMDTNFATRPFFFEWARYGINREGLYIRRSTPTGPHFSQAGDQAPVAWEWVSATSARIVFLESRDTAYVWPSMPAVRISLQNNDTLMRLERKEASTPWSVRILAFTQEAMHLDSTMTVYFKMGESLLETPLPEAVVDGFMCEVSAISKNGEYDFSVPYRADNAPWTFGGALRVVDVSTGKVVQGRQDIPPVHDLDGSMFAAMPGVVDFSASRFRQGFAPVVLPESEQGYAESSMELLRTTAKQKAACHV